VCVYEARFTTDERFIGFDLASELVEGASLHGEPDAMEHEPRGLLSHADAACDLVGTDAVLGVADQPHGGKPLVEADRRILEDGSDLDGELLTRVLRATSPDPASLDERHGLTAACRASHAIGPAQIDHEGERPVRIGEVADRVYEGRRYGWGVSYLVHAQRIAGPG